MTNSSRACTIWFTGLSGAGKSTISQQLVPLLKARGCKVEVLDGDVVRTNLSKGLGFSKEDRDTNIRRIGFVCHLLTRNGVFAIAAAISPYKAIRNENRALIKDFVEVYVKASLDTCIQRDVKGLYKKALAGEIKEFTGVSDPYEPPDNPEVICNTEKETPAESAQRIIRKLEEMGYLTPLAEVGGDGVYAAKAQTAIKITPAEVAPV
ncbi:MAG: adenylyl-sulfate kinase [candidate division KSB1 bacterium]|nr:adenylyl-sulfate kinase [candidate division KSB1 bacterium]MDZ7302418.1 adenylyl-sulfate kinase [candidate division KSB1 bacterium]MDZ7311620.1 adenylyl-sulfate kinase [candidate division KSB1 bacterium]